jgi:hypothetical protein
VKIAQCYLSLNDRAKAIMFFYKGNIISQEIQILFLLELYFTIRFLSHPFFFFFRQRELSVVDTALLFQYAVSLVLQLGLFMLN